MSDETYNGWTGKGDKGSAYATWRVALEMFDGRDPEDYGWSEEEPPDAATLAENLRADVEELLDATLDSSTHTIRGWVEAFLADVEYEEIAENMLSDWPES